MSKPSIGYKGLLNHTTDISQLDAILKEGASNKISLSSKQHQKTLLNREKPGTPTSSSTKVPYTHKYSNSETPKAHWRVTWLLVAVVLFVGWVIFKDPSPRQSQVKNQNYSNTIANNEVSSPPSSNSAHTLDFICPEVGTDIYTIANLRWLLRAEIRLNAMENRIRSKKAYTEYNKLVNDYNSRLNGKYYQKDYDIANKQVENLRKQIEKNAISNIEYLNSL